MPVELENLGLLDVFQRECKALVALAGADDSAKGGVAAGCAQEVLGTVQPIAK